MKITTYNKKTHRKMVKRWWRDWHDIVADLDSLIVPNECFIASSASGEPVLAVVAYGIYTKKIPIVMIAWVISNPEDWAFPLRGKALNMVVKHIAEISKKMNKKIVLTYSESKALAKVYSRHGFKTADENVTQYIMGVA